MPDIDLGALTIPVFAAIFSMGWTASQMFVVKPLREILSKQEARIKLLEKKFLGLGDD
ncbi:hypothetical protein [Qipengyuania sp.]|uniref:hypothetical protein n=1 Tax=Qipengyuania sp. TaxID=2004515 RepID=UPI0035C7F846